MNTDIQTALKYSETLGADYTDIRYENREKRNLALENQTPTQAQETVETGYFIRVLKDGAWGYSRTTQDNQQAVNQAVKQAYDLAQHTAKHQETKTLLETPTNKETLSWVKEANANTDLEDIQSFLTDLTQELKPYDAIKDTDTIFADVHLTKQYANTEGRQLEWDMNRSFIRLEMTAKQEGQIASRALRTGGTHDFSHYNYDNLKQILHEEANATLEAFNLPNVPGGQHNVICDPHLTGVFVHEAVGHASEADLVAAGDSCFTGKLGKQVGNPLVTIRDNARIENSFGSIPFDDEGTPTTDTVIMQKGILQQYLSDRATATKYDLPVTGSAKAQDQAYKPLVRMSNTIMDPGHHTLEELFEELGTGYYCAGSRGGQVDTGKGDFMFNSTDTWYIENGEQKHRVNPVSLTGNTLTTLQNIQALSKETHLSGPGFCGKGQMMPVSDGGPYTLIKDCLIG